jgi:hypothetical protein
MRADISILSDTVLAEIREADKNTAIKAANKLTNWDLRSHLSPAITPTHHEGSGASRIDPARQRQSGDELRIVVRWVVFG